MTLSCVSTPISWTRLEVYVAGEDVERERVEIRKHLDACDACQRCLAMIEADGRPLRPLVLPAARHGKSVLSLRRAMPAAGALALAAALLLFLRPVRRSEDELTGGTRAKGATIGFALVRDDSVELTGEGGTYRDGERFKARVSCPADMHASWDVVVFDNGEVSFPLEPRFELPCGNGVVLPGAFRLIGHNPMTVCVVHREGGLVDRDELRRNDRAAPREASCKSLRPAP